MSAVRLVRIAMGLRLVSAAALLIAVVSLVWRPALDAEIPDEAAGALAADSGQAFLTSAPSRAGDAQRIVGNNLFAASRRAPVRRYAPGTEAAAPQGSEPGGLFDPAMTGESPSLLGTVIDESGARALLQPSAFDSAAKFYRVGERVGSYRVRRIDAGRVVLQGPDGRLVLELPKPNEVRQ